MQPDLPARTLDAIRQKAPYRQHPLNLAPAATARWTWLLILCWVLLAPLAQGGAAGPEDPSCLPMLEAQDVAALRKHLGQWVIVIGTVKTAEWSRTGKVMNIEFAGGEGRGLLAVVFESRREAFNAAWGGDFPKAINGRRVRLYGELQEYGGYDEQQKGRPQMILNTPEQVTLPQ